MKTTAAQIMTLIKLTYVQADRTIGEFKVSMAKDPHAALSWGDKAFDKASILKLYGYIIEQNNKKELTLKDFITLKDRIKVQLIHKTKYPHFSTSTCSNLIAICDNAARAEFVEMIEECV